MRFRKANAADLSKDLSQLLDDLKEVITSKEREASPAASLLLNQAASTLEKVRSASNAAVCKTNGVAHSAHTYVHDSPWRAVGGALLAGALLGLVISRR